MPGLVPRDRDGAIEVLTLHRPEKPNTLSNDLISELHAALDDCERDERVRAVIITGAGRAFSAGADIAGIARQLAALAKRRPGT